MGVSERGDRVERERVWDVFKRWRERVVVIRGAIRVGCE